MRMQTSVQQQHKDDPKNPKVTPIVTSSLQSISHEIEISKPIVRLIIKLPARKEHDPPEYALVNFSMSCCLYKFHVSVCDLAGVIRQCAPADLVPAETFGTYPD